MKISANLLFRRPIRKLAGAVAIAAVTAAGASITSAARADEVDNVHIEIWHGVQKLDVADPRGLNGVPEHLRQLFPFTRWREKDNLVARGLPAVARIAPWSQRLQTRLGSFPDLPARAAAPAPLIPKPIGLAAATKRIKDPKPFDEIREPKAPVLAQQPAPNPAPLPMPSAPAPQSAESINTALIQVAIVFSAAVVGPLVFLVTFFRMLRRHTRQYGPMFRFEGGNQPVVAGPFTATVPSNSDNTSAPATASESMPEGDRFKEPEPEHLPEQFDLGPSYEEERRMKLNKADQQEQAAIEQLIEENLRFQEEIQEAREPKDI